MDPAELFHLLSGGAEFAEHMPLEIEFVNRADGVRAVEILLRPRRDADRPGSANARPHRAQREIIVKNLNAAVPPIAYINVALGVSRNRVRSAELTGLLALHAAADGLDEPAFLVILHNPGVAITVGHKNISGRVPGDVRFAAEGI